jgi:hypothetical protein
MVVLTGRCVIRVGPSRGLSLTLGTWIGRWSVDGELTLSGLEATVVCWSRFVEKLQEW